MKARTRKLCLSAALVLVFMLSSATCFHLLERPAEMDRAKRADAAFAVLAAGLDGAQLDLLRELGVTGDKADQHKWDWLGSLLFAASLFTTVGYGDPSPSTPGGKVAAVFVGIIGFSGFAYFLRILAQALIDKAASAFKRAAQNKVEKLRDRTARRESDAAEIRVASGSSLTSRLQRMLERVAGSQENAAIVICATELVLLWLVGAGVVSAAEDVSYGEAVYFAFLTTSTIGLGSFVPESSFGQVFTLFYMLTSIALVVLLLHQVAPMVGERFEAHLVRAEVRAEARRMEKLMPPDISSSDEPDAHGGDSEPRDDDDEAKEPESMEFSDSELDSDDRRHATVV